MAIRTPQAENAPRSAPLRLAFVVQRYGQEVNGGAELHCRMLAERLAKRPEIASVSVLTTCAQDYETWRNHYPEGESRLNGVRVLRFPTSLPRLGWLQGVAKLAGRLPGADRATDALWLWAQGPVAPGLLKELTERASEYDAVLFFTYLYHPTVRGLARLRARRVLIPTAHDEPAIRRGMYRQVFETPEAIAFNSVEERDFVARQFGLTLTNSDIVGCGVDLPAPYQGRRARERPYVLYLGRLAEPKGVATLAQHFLEFQRRFADVTFESADGRYRGRELELVFAGSGDESLVPQNSQLVREGFVSDERRAALIAGAELLAMPSRYESLSLVTLEAFAARVPVLADRQCDVTAGHVARSQAGAAYHGADEFGTELSRLLASRALRTELGERGRRYVETSYAWPQVEERLLALVRRAASR